MLLPRSTDVFVVGGGPAGLAAAIAARRRGFDVTVADGGAPPIEKACGEGIMPDGVAAAAALGISLQDAGGRAFRGIRFCQDRLSVEAAFLAGPGLGLRRADLHLLLVEHARAAGVHIQWRTPVNGIEDIRARWIVGADGGQSAVRRWAGLDAVLFQRRRYGFARHYRVAPWTSFTEIHWGDAGQLYVTPLSESEICVASISRQPQLRLEMALANFPHVRTRLTGSAATQERGGVTASRWLRRVTGGRVALVGDASGSVDAVTGEGICLLLQQAGALAGALESGDLDEYEKAHRRMLLRPRCMAELMLLMDRHGPMRRRAIRAMAAKPSLFAGMLAMHVGEVTAGDAIRNSLMLGWQMMTA